MNANLNAALETIARDRLRIETLERRMADHLDFHSVSVWSLADALQEAYELGRRDAEAARK